LYQPSSPVLCSRLPETPADRRPLGRVPTSGAACCMANQAAGPVWPTAATLHQYTAPILYCHQYCIATNTAPIAPPKPGIVPHPPWRIRRIDTQPRFELKYLPAPGHPERLGDGQGSPGGWCPVPGAWWPVAGGCCLVAGGWWLMAGAWCSMWWQAAGVVTKCCIPPTRSPAVSLQPPYSLPTASLQSPYSLPRECPYSV
jgi:hypothetical protein